MTNILATSTVHLFQFLFASQQATTQNVNFLLGIDILHKQLQKPSHFLHRNCLFYGSILEKDLNRYIDTIMHFFEKFLKQHKVVFFLQNEIVYNIKRILIFQRQFIYYDEIIISVNVNIKFIWNKIIPQHCNILSFQRRIFVPEKQIQVEQDVGKTIDNE